MRVGIRRSDATNAASSLGALLGSFHCAVFRNGNDPIVIAENDMPVPADHWEFRTSGLWVDTICETPFVHWSYGLEAFGLAIDDPLELLGKGYGIRVPIGWELEFESTPDRYARSSGIDSDVQHHRQVGELHGILQFADGSQTFTGPALRHHRWGLAGADGAEQTVAITGVGTTSDQPMEVALPTDDGVWWVARSSVGLDARLSVERRRRPRR